MSRQQYMGFGVRGDMPVHRAACEVLWQCWAAGLSFPVSISAAMVGIVTSLPQLEGQNRFLDSAEGAVATRNISDVPEKLRQRIIYLALYDRPAKPRTIRLFCPATEAGFRYGCCGISYNRWWKACKNRDHGIWLERGFRYGL